MPKGQTPGWSRYDVLPHSRASLQSLTPAEAAAIEAMTARIIPGTPDDPGAREAEVVVYIDRALAGPYAYLRPFYRRGVELLNAHAAAAHGAPFPHLTEETQDAVLRALESGRVPGFAAEPGDDQRPVIPTYGDPTAAQFFAVVRQHTIEGMFSDPMYGGNRDAAGWRLLGFPGAQFGYRRADMRLDADLSALPVMTLADLRDFYERGGDQDPEYRER
jgi:gluconate 2-dehydrogenase gamma chain